MWYTLPVASGDSTQGNHCPTGATGPQGWHASWDPHDFPGHLWPQHQSQEPPFGLG